MILNLCWELFVGSPEADARRGRERRNTRSGPEAEGGETVKPKAPIFLEGLLFRPPYITHLE